jgi:hypothetical protein
MSRGGERYNRLSVSESPSNKQSDSINDKAIDIEESKTIGFSGSAV